MRGVLIMAACLLAPACAPPPDAPAARGKVCRTQDDCNRDADGGVRRCGVLRVCVADRCEAALDAGSRVVPCSQDAGPSR